MGAFFGWIAKQALGKLASLRSGNTVSEIIALVRGNPDSQAEIAKFQSAAQTRVAEIQSETEQERIRAHERIYGWKDDFGLILVSAPYMLVFVAVIVGMFLIGCNEETPPLEKADLMISQIERGISILSSFPGWWTYGIFAPAMLYVLGIKGKQAYDHFKNGKPTDNPK